MKLFLFSVSLLFFETVQGYHQSCIREELPLGDVDGDLISDFEILDLQASKDMRLRQLNICVDRQDRFRGL